MSIISHPPFTPRPYPRLKSSHIYFPVLLIHVGYYQRSLVDLKLSLHFAFVLSFSLLHSPSPAVSVRILFLNNSASFLLRSHFECHNISLSGLSQNDPIAKSLARNNSAINRFPITAACVFYSLI